MTEEPAEVVSDDGEVLTSPPANIVPAQPRQSVEQARVDSVARMLDAAYMRASMLEITPEEAKALTADFRDDEVRPGAKGDEKLLYIQHESVRARMLTVFGPGRWVPITRRMWTEPYTTYKGEEAVRVYADVVVLVRGCYVGEAIGAGSYFPGNAKQDYTDAAEAAVSEALRRVCGKVLGVGLHVWNKAWCDAWKQRQKGGNRTQQATEQPAEQPKPQPRGYAKDWAALKKWIDQAAAKLAAEGKPVAEAVLVSRVCDAVSKAGVNTNPYSWTDDGKGGTAALKLATQALKDAMEAIRAADFPTAEELEELDALLRNAEIVWADVRDSEKCRALKLPAMQMEMSRKQLGAVLELLRGEAEGKAEQVEEGVL